MRGLAVTIEDHEAGGLGLYLLPTNGTTLVGRERTLQIPFERIIRRRQAPFGQSARRHRRQVPLPGRIGRCPYLEAREIGCAGQDVQGHLAFLNAAFQVVHQQRGFFHVLDVQLCLRAHHFQPQVEPDIFRYVHRAGEARTVVNLPVEAGVENWRVLHGVRQPGLMLEEINPFGIGAVVGDAKLNAEKPTARRGGNIDINNASRISKSLKTAAAPSRKRDFRP
jgi:hypothetical protein